MTTTRRTRTLRMSLVTTGALLAVPLLLAGCAQGAETQANAEHGTGSSASAANEAKAPLALEGAWAKANAGGKMTDMSGVFGKLVNTTDKEIVLESAASPAAKMVQLHETGADGKMSEVKGGFTIPAKGSLELAPGGNHIMLMEMPKPIAAGDQVDVTLKTADGKTVDVHALVKDYSGANESYDGGSEHGGDHGSH
ncbi:copper chaperone PCu(A)C [Leucobacter sp. CSA2]|uniref:Copper chaperone PCu(A)C n=1 Tax=Leucobacter edaphi TaxID=2796472 RepID=A0A934QA17_9MICO|nr:copper chaperone PCu(A)C [Leucobacter edaphi]MBK0420914.1 copper chaperone PCu(A)C [Leucobacter edaphi]